jgi:hypothetical protein
MLERQGKPRIVFGIINKERGYLWRLRLERVPSEILRQKYSIINEQLMKSYSKTQLAEAAGVSVATFRRWLKTDEAYFHSQGIQTSAKLLPPHVVRYLCEKYCIDL